MCSNKRSHKKDVLRVWYHDGHGRLYGNKQVFYAPYPMYGPTEPFGDNCKS